MSEKLYVIGKDAQDNWNLFRKAKQTDWWFHLDKFPSAHGFCSEINKNIVNEIALIIKMTSKAKNLNNTQVIYTQKSNLKLGSKVGEIIIRSHKKCRYIKV